MQKNPDIDILNTEEVTVDSDNEPIDVEKMKKYLIMHVNVRKRDKGQYKHYYVPFRRCTINDFEANGLVVKD